MKDFTYAELLGPGEPGDLKVDLSLTARELAALQLLVSIGTQIGVGELAYVACQSHGLAERFALEARAAEARVGVALAGVFNLPEQRVALTARLATIDQERAALEEVV